MGSAMTVMLRAPRATITSGPTEGPGIRARSEDLSRNHSRLHARRWQSIRRQVLELDRYRYRSCRRAADSKSIMLPFPIVAVVAVIGRRIARRAVSRHTHGVGRVPYGEFRSRLETA